MATRTSRINALRGFLREFGIDVAQGARVGVEQIARVLADPGSVVPDLIRNTLKFLVEEIRLLEARVSQVERELTALARQSPASKTLLTIPGVGLLTATAMVAATSGNVSHFRDARHFASWFGLTPKEHSSGSSYPSANPRNCGGGRSMIRGAVFTRAASGRAAVPRPD